MEKSVIISSYLFMATVLALAFVPLRSQGVKIPAIRFHFNMYTGPGYLSVLMGIVNIVLMVVLFREYRINLEKKDQVMKGMRSFDTSKKGTG